MQMSRFNRFVRPGALVRIAGGLAACTALAVCVAPAPARATLTLAPKPAPTAPIANGDSFQYAITDTSVVTYPSQPPYTTTSTANATESVAYPVTYGSKKNTYQLTTTLQDTSDSYGYVEQDAVGFERSGSLYALEYFAEAQTLYDGSQSYGTDSTTYGKPYAITAEYPESVGLQWTGNIPIDYLLSENFGSYGIGVRERQQADGAYVEVQTISYGSSQSNVEFNLKSNGTGTLLEEASSQPTLKYVFGLPVERGSAEVIPVKQGRDTTYVPDWYPGGGQPFSPPLTDNFQVVSLASAPSNCGAQSGQAAYDIHQTAVGLDPVGGEYFSIVTDEYDSPTQGMICSIDTYQNAYYDNLVSGSLDFTQTYTEVQVLTGKQISPLHASARAPVRPMHRNRPARFALLGRP